MAVVYVGALFAPGKENRSLPARRIRVRLAEGLLNVDEIALECKERIKEVGKFG